ncbi:alpha/beta hydrolase domain-containing protein 17C isoform X2 [Maylandia zebra]|nr:alpha/beta hydrolase domain-containing protein 17C isoform X2 [Maylandia zebra]XP_026040762.1 alpha/beta hydrolase domain-containing protein 17C isoform X2 [Astatotilapia calliptera]XP_039858062.1 alpha/beta hydrolase domain-containing protein 17C isoform X2 [Simochromis diagramma]
MPEQGPRMNGFSIGELCWLFCCPPCPSRIAAKLAFLPPEPTYSMHTDANGVTSLHLTERADWQYSQRELDAVEVFTTRSSRGNRVACMFVRCAPNSRYTLLFSHGYGVSTGKPSEKNLYADIEAAWQMLRNKYGVTPENIILYGQSIGTVPTIDLAARYECAAVILHSPLMSGLRVAFPDTRKTYCFDAFPSIDKVSKVASPVLVIHGTEDEVIDFSHGLAMYERCPRAVEPLWVEGAGHNDIELYAQYLERLKQFISFELSTS